MKILFIHQFFIVGDDPGAGRHEALLRYFVEAGHEVHILAGSVNYMTNRSKFHLFKLYERQTSTCGQITWVYAFPTLRSGLSGRFLSFVSFLIFSLPFLLKEKPDVIIATSPPPTAGVLGWLFSRLKRVPWIFEIRDLWPEFGVSLGALGNKGFLRWTLDRMVRFLYRSADYIITLTWGLEKELLRLGLPQNKLQTIPNGVDSIFVVDRPMEKFPRLHDLRLQKKFMVMYVGAFGRANQVLRLVELAERVANHSSIHFVFVGEGSERTALENSCKEKNLTNVTFLGSVPRNKVPDVLHYADLGISILANVPAFRHAISNKLFDYMASGIPVLLALPEGDAWEILKNANGGVRVDPDDLAMMEHWVLYFQKNREEAKQMGSQGKTYALTHFMRDHLAQNYLECIERVAAKGNKRIYLRS